MRVNIHQDPTTFFERVRSILEEQESANNLILGITARLVEHPEWTESQPLLSVVEDEGGDISLIAIQTPPYNILLSAPETVMGQRLVESVDALAGYLKHSEWSIPGVNAEKGLSELFAVTWSEATGQPYRVHMRERVYELRQVTPPPNPPGGFLRTATLAETGLMAAWRYAFEQEALGKGDPERAKTLTVQRIEVGDLFVWDDDGPVSTAIQARPTRHGYTVSFVYTPPALRGRGYASAGVAALSQHILDSGKQFCNLFTDLGNPTSNSIYQKIGYRPVCDYTEYKFGD